MSTRLSRLLGRASLAAAVLASSAAAADPHAALVLRTEGATDPATRARVDSLVLRLARAGGLTATAGDITLADAAAAVGCKPEVPACREDVMATLSVDEVISATTYVSGGELKVVVRRGAKGEAPREASATVAMIDSSDATLEAGLGPLFNVASKPAVTPPVTPPPAVPVVAPQVPPPTGEVPASPVTAPPAQPGPDGPGGDTFAPSHRRLELVGVGVGGGAILLSFILWGAAGNTEIEIQKAPTATAADLQHLHDLEQQGDSQANGGNFLFVTGLLVGGISGYLLYRDHQRASSAPHARITPMLVNHGAGLALTFGGSP